MAPSLPVRTHTTCTYTRMQILTTQYGPLTSSTYTYNMYVHKDADTDHTVWSPHFQYVHIQHVRTQGCKILTTQYGPLTFSTYTYNMYIHEAAHTECIVWPPHICTTCTEGQYTQVHRGTHSSTVANTQNM